MAGALIQPNHSDFGSLILFMRKADASLRFYIDYNGINKVTRKDAYPLPRVSVTLDEIRDVNFTPISPSHMPFGEFEYVVRSPQDRLSDT
jgi:hypothetical protein